MRTGAPELSEFQKQTARNTLAKARREGTNRTVIIPLLVLGPLGKPGYLPEFLASRSITRRRAWLMRV